MEERLTKQMEAQAKTMESWQLRQTEMLSEQEARTAHEREGRLAAEARVRELEHELQLLQTQHFQQQQQSAAAAGQYGTALAAACSSSAANAPTDQPPTPLKPVLRSVHHIPCP